MRLKTLVALSICTIGLTTPAMAADWPATAAEVIAATKATDWRELDPERTLYMDLNGGRVVIELNPEFAPRHVANIIQLVRQGYFNALPIVRSQDNYVVQWGDPDGKRDLGKAHSSLDGEYQRSARGLGRFEPLPDGDVYAEQVGYLRGFPIALDSGSKNAWLAHCYGMLGVGRGEAADSGSGAELYVVTGHSPRHLDRNVTLVGRVW
ncbi:MAG: peptidylprolyl isomerase, partial [Xanthomonadales bacterium]|nr:peptidylprolyl isomerase [Xanthomonadales bacterium]